MSPSPKLLLCLSLFLFPALVNCQFGKKVLKEEKELSPHQFPLLQKKAKNGGRLPSKIMVRTFDTSASASKKHSDSSSTSTSTERPLVSDAASYVFYYNNPYVSRKPSIPPKKLNLQAKKKDRFTEKPSSPGKQLSGKMRKVPVAETTQKTFVSTRANRVPPTAAASNRVTSKSRRVSEEAPSTQDFPNTSTPVPAGLRVTKRRRLRNRTSRPFSKPVENSATNFKFPPFTGTSEATTTSMMHEETTLAPKTSSTQFSRFGTRQRSSSKLSTIPPTAAETTISESTETSPPEASIPTTVFTKSPIKFSKEVKRRPAKLLSTSGPIRIITKTFKPVYKTVDPYSNAEIAEDTTKKQPDNHSSQDVSTSTEKQSTEKKRIHYIITVIGNGNSSSTSGQINEEHEYEEEDFEVTTDSTSTDQIEDHEEFPKKSKSSIDTSSGSKHENKGQTTEDPFGHLETIEIPPSAIIDNSPPFSFFPSIGNANYRHRQHQTLTFPRQNSIQSFNTPTSTRGKDGLKLIPLRTVVTYQPESGHTSNRNRQGSNSPFLSSKTVLYYTHVSPQLQGVGSPPVVNLGHTPLGSSSASQSSILPPGVPLSLSSTATVSSPIAAQSFYLDSLRGISSSLSPPSSSNFNNPITSKPIFSRPIIVDYTRQ